jgi:hypothetical protein
MIFWALIPLAVDRFGNGLPTSKQDSRISLTLNPGYLLLAGQLCRMRG